MDVSKMTSAERAELMAQLEAEERAEKQKRENDIAAYKNSVDEFCRGKFARLQALSNEMRRLKEEIFSDAETLITLKEELFKTKCDRRSDTFTTSDGRITISLGNRTNDGWDNTVEVGIAKVKEYLQSLAKDEDGAKMFEVVMKLLAKDRKGNLRAGAMIQLEQHARRFGDPLFIEGVEIIRQSYRPVDSCQFVSASWKDDHGIRHTLPLSLAAME